MLNTTDTAAACASVHPAGIGTTPRASAAIRLPVPSGNRPITRSPTARPVTPSPISTIDAGGLAAQRGVVGEHAERDHHVAEVGADRMHANAHLAGRQRHVGSPELGCSTRFSNVPGSERPSRHAPFGRRRQHRVDGAAGTHPRGVGARRRA